MLLTCVGAVSAISNGGFEDPALADGTSFQANMGSGLTGWTIEGGNVDLIKEYWIPAELKQSLDLSGDSRGTISQQIATDPGKTYKLTFSMAGNPECNGLNTDPQNMKSLKVYWDNAIVGTLPFDTAGKTFAALGWTPVTIANLPSSAAAATNLRFIDDSSGSDTRCGVTLDAVNVEPEQAIPTPEFPTMALPAALIVGMLGAVLFIQRTKEQ